LAMAGIVFAALNVVIYTIGYLFIIRPWREAALEVDKDDQEVTSKKADDRIMFDLDVNSVPKAKESAYDREMKSYDAGVQAARVESVNRRVAMLEKQFIGGVFRADGVQILQQCEELIVECEALIADSEGCWSLRPVVRRLQSWLLRSGVDLRSKDKANLKTSVTDDRTAMHVLKCVMTTLDSMLRKADVVLKAPSLATSPNNRPSRITVERDCMKEGIFIEAHDLLKEVAKLLREVQGLPCSLEAIEKELHWRRAKLEALASTKPVKPPPSEAIVPHAGTFAPSTPSRGAVDAELDGAFSECETSRSARVDGARLAIFGVARRRLRSIRSRVRLRASPAQACHRRRRLLSCGRRRAPRSPTSWIGKSRTTRRTRSRAARRPLRLAFALLEKPPRRRRACAASSPGRKRRLNPSWAACRWPPTCVVNAASGRAT
jgi:hypothetical protein